MLLQLQVFSNFVYLSFFGVLVEFVSSWKTVRMNGPGSKPVNWLNFTGVERISETPKSLFSNLSSKTFSFLQKICCKCRFINQIGIVFLSKYQRIQHRAARRRAHLGHLLTCSAPARCAHRGTRVPDRKPSPLLRVIITSVVTCSWLLSATSGTKLDSLSARACARPFPIFRIHEHVPCALALILNSVSGIYRVFGNPPWGLLNQRQLSRFSYSFGNGLDVVMGFYESPYCVRSYILKLLYITKATIPKQCTQTFILMRLVVRRLPNRAT